MQTKIYILRIGNPDYDPMPELKKPLSSAIKELLRFYKEKREEDARRERE